MKKKHLTGSIGGNHLDSDYKAGKDGRFQLLGGGVTEMATPTMVWDGRYSTVFFKTTTYSITNQVLTLSDGSTNNVLRYTTLVPPAPLPLKGTRWDLESFEESDGISVGMSPVRPANSIHISFTEETASGSSGCNGFEGTIQTIQGQRIEIGEMQSTTMACGDKAMIQEQRFLEAFGKMTRYTISANHLVLSNPDQTLSLHFYGAENP